MHLAERNSLAVSEEAAFIVTCGYHLRVSYMYASYSGHWVPFVMFLSAVVLLSQCLLLVTLLYCTSSAGCRI